jgi:exodeoxyribonuclease III
MGLTIVTWNVNSLRSAIGKGFLAWLGRTAPDIICLQEIRATLEQLRPLEPLLKGYQAVWHPAIRPGYAGTAILTRFKPFVTEYGLNNESDPEGRSLTVDFGNFRVASLYAPNAPPDTSKMESKCLWLDKLRTHISLRSDKPFLIGGDLNVACSKLDSRGVIRPNGVNGCTDEERNKFQKILEECRLCDPLRVQSGTSVLSTWWHARESERRSDNGVRFDYILLNHEHRNLVLAGAIHSDIWGSDHCPTSLTINFPTEHLQLANVLVGQASLL